MIIVEQLSAMNPFPGLRPFHLCEADRFFGRERQIEDLVMLLARSPLVAVAGASGCGKSSLVLAGLLSRLAHDRAAGGRVEWRPAVLRPGNEPIARLAAELAAALYPAAAADENRAASLEGGLRLGGRGLAEEVRLARIEPHVRVLVVVDQFEEVFRFKQMIDPEEATAFVKLLLHAVRDSDSHVSVVITLRSDALGYCAEFRDLPEAINRGQYLVPRLTREQRKEAIVRPVELRGFKLAPRLVQRILNDVTDDYDDLPVMQHALTRTWQHWAAACQGSRPIDLADYEAIGGADEALSRHADEAYESLIGLAAVVERIFRALTERDAQGIETRRPLSFEQLRGVADCDRKDVEQVVDRFRRPDTAFLMPPSDVELATNPVIDISHESLIRQWGRLRLWTQREAESRAQVLRLVDAAGRYARKDGDLWRGRDLEHACEWRSSERPTVPWISLCTGGDGASQWESAQTFLADSEQAVAREHRRDRWLRWGLGSLAALVIVGTVAGALVFALQQQQARYLQERATDLQAQATYRAKSGEMVGKALLALDEDPARSAHLALEAIKLDPDNPHAEHALRQSLATLEIAHTEHIVPLHEAIADARFTKDGTRLVVASDNNIRVFDAQDYKILSGPFAREQPLTKAWLIADNTVLVTLTEDGKGQLQSVDGNPIHSLSCEGKENSVWTLAISPDEKHVAAGCLKGEIRIWDVRGADAQRWPSLADGVTITALAFSADTQYLASGDADGNATIWKLGQSEPWIGARRRGSKESPIRHFAAIRDVCFYPSPDSELLATASDDHTAIVWKLDLKGRRLAPEKKGEPKKWTLAHDRPVIGARFTPRTDNAQPLMTISDKRVYFWTNDKSPGIRSHDDWVIDADVSADNELVVSASNDGTARVWSARSGAPIAVLRGHRHQVTRAFFGAKGQVVTASLDGNLRVWRVRQPLLLASASRWMLDAAFDPAGKRVALCGEEGCRIIDPQDISRRPSPVQEKEKLEGVTADAMSRVSWSADGRFLLVHRSSHGINPKFKAILWDADSKRVVTPKWLEQWPRATFSAGTNELLTVSDKGVVAVWDAAALDQADPRPKYDFPPTRNRWWAQMSPDGRWIAAIEEDRVALLAPTKRESAPRKLEGHRGDIKFAEFSRDGRWIVTASLDRTARIWPVDPRPGERPYVELAGGHTAALSFAAFNDDGTRVVTGSADHTIRVWDARNGRELAALRWHDEGVNQVRFIGDGQILSTSDDGTVKLGRCEVCNLKIEELRERARREAMLTDDELVEIQEQSRVTMPDLKLPVFLSLGR